uniref:Uncharacterized protein n=1 Tax=Oryza punctata TaxID=4537 RepID=A0A0E0JL04_ORYPU
MAMEEEQWWGGGAVVAIEEERWWRRRRSGDGGVAVIDLRHCYISLNHKLVSSSVRLHHLDLLLRCHHQLAPYYLPRLNLHRLLASFILIFCYNFDQFRECVLG